MLHKQGKSTTADAIEKRQGELAEAKRKWPEQQQALDTIQKNLNQIVQELNKYKVFFNWDMELVDKTTTAPWALQIIERLGNQEDT